MNLTSLSLNKVELAEWLKYWTWRLCRWPSYWHSYLYVDKTQLASDIRNTEGEYLDVTQPIATSSQIGDSSQLLGGYSAKELPPIELSKRLFVDIEHYPNLLKRFQEGKVCTKPIKTEEVRLASIKNKDNC